MSKAEQDPLVLDPFCRCCGRRMRSQRLKQHEEWCFGRLPRRYQMLAITGFSIGRASGGKESRQPPTAYFVVDTADQGKTVYGRATTSGGPGRSSEDYRERAEKECRRLNLFEKEARTAA